MKTTTLLCALALAGCGGGPAAPSPPDAPAAQPDVAVAAADAAAPRADAPAASPDAGPGSDGPTELVRVTTAAGGQAIGELTAVAQTSDGVVAQTVAAGSGAAQVAVPSGGMVTVAFVSGGVYYLVTVLDVAPGVLTDDQIVVGPIGKASPGPAVGQVTVTPPGSLEGAVSYAIAGATCSELYLQGLPGTASPAAFAIDSRCVAASAPTLDIVAAARDTSGAALAYSLGSAGFDSGNDASIVLPAWTAARGVDVSLSHVPGSATSVVASAELSFGTAPYAAEARILTADAAGTPFQLHIPGAGFASPVSYEIAVVNNVAGQSQSTRRIAGAVAAPYAPLTVDLTGLLPALHDLAVTTTDPARPSMAWAADGSLGDAAGGFVTLVWQDAALQRHYWFLDVPVSSSVQAPALPPELDAWAPAPGTTFTLTAAFFAGLGRGDLVRNFSVDSPPKPATPGRSTSLTCFLAPSC